MTSFTARGSLAALVALAVCAVAPSAHAWGANGHRIVADLAQRQLTPQARAQVDRLLHAENANSLSDIASWADELRDNPETKALGKATGSLHYINFADKTCTYVPPRDCSDGRCVVGGLQKYVAILGDSNASDADRAQALNFVVHFVGDVHQPLHAGYRDDKGGNDYQVQMDGKGSNLHRVWDSSMLNTRGLKWQKYAQNLADNGPVVPPPASEPLDNPYAQWAEESCRITRDDGVYPAGHVIDDAYVSAELPIAERRLREAGKRLADLLNSTLRN
ncbi:S1/P1 nuclease [Luteibacter rhizovicinus]|uniref:S1/P1 nuclease n=1 Tax=Luteibacter rhizovicinus TaxID=242606 RepID=A0A4R3YWJ2_9GAMM|nr:S1/P1 nuclease [Luteibacter rhizovicinus]TCV95794.1 S1/P1 nuclease [Luteibacter rhizovicinus]